MGEQTVSCADPSHILMIEMMGSPVTVSSLRNLLVCFSLSGTVKEIFTLS